MTTKLKHRGCDAGEKQTYRDSLRHHGRVQESDGKPLRPGVTHVADTSESKNSDAEPILIRKRFSAI
jgi:hypothetical protein